MSDVLIMQLLQNNEKNDVIIESLKITAKTANQLEVCIVKIRIKNEV